MTQVSRWSTNWARSSTRYRAIWLTGMKPRMWFTSHSSPPVLWPVTRTSTSAPSTRSDQSSTCTALLGSDNSYRPSSGLSCCTTTWTIAPGWGGTSNCRSETTPCWRPANSTKTSSRRTAITRPLCKESGSKSCSSARSGPSSSSIEAPSIARRSSSSMSAVSFSRTLGFGWGAVELRPLRPVRRRVGRSARAEGWARHGGLRAEG